MIGLSLGSRWRAFPSQFEKWHGVWLTASWWMRLDLRIRKLEFCDGILLMTEAGSLRWGWFTRGDLCGKAINSGLLWIKSLNITHSTCSSHRRNVLEMEDRSHRDLLIEGTRSALATSSFSSSHSPLLKAFHTQHSTPKANTLKLIVIFDFSFFISKWT